MAQNTQPSFSVQRFRSHLRAKSEDTRTLSTGYRATMDSRSKIHSRIDLNPVISETVFSRSSSVGSSSNRRKPAPAPVMVRSHDRERSASPLAGLIASKSADATTASTTANSGPLTAPSTLATNTTKQPTKPRRYNKDHDASSFVDSPEMPTPERKRPPKELQVPYSEGFYGLAGTLSDCALFSSEEEEDSDDEVSDMEFTDDMDHSGDIGQNVRDLIKATNAAFFAIDTGLDEPLGSPSLRRSHEARTSQESRMSASPTMPMKTASRLRNPYSRSSNSSHSRTDSGTSSLTNSPSAPTSAPAPVPEKPVLTSHWSESSTDSRDTSIGVSHRATAPLSPMRSSQQFLKPSKKKRRSPGGSNMSKFGRGATGLGSRWGLSEGVHGILTGQRFKKPEVEELLTPERIAQLRMSKSANDSKDSIEQPGSRPQSSQSQHEPIHKSQSATSQPASGDLKTTRASKASMQANLAQPERVGRASEESIPIMIENLRDANQGKKSSESPSDVANARNGPPAPVVDDTLSKSDDEKQPSLRAVSPNANSVSSKYSSESGDDEGVRSSEEDSASSASSPPPTPPAKHPGRASLGPKLNTPLRTKLNAPLPALPTDESDNDYSKMSEEDDDNIYLKSTPYTMTRPTFKHGPITFSKAELGRAALTADDTMDWTAFQMAILGGAGELAPEDLVDEDDDLCEDLSKWFEEFVMDPGMLLRSHTPSTPDSSRSSLSSRSGSFASDENLPIPCDSEMDVQDRDLGYNEVKFFRRRTFKRWDGTSAPITSGHHRPASVDDGSHRRGLRHVADAYRRGTAIEHIRKPGNNWGIHMKLNAPKMDPMVVGQGDDDDETESGGGAKMGFNLNSDLGDYLRWEQVHLNGGGF